MNALNEVNKLLPNLFTIHRPTMIRSDDNDGLTSEKFIVKKTREIRLISFMNFIL
jgi:hypothetical protein